MKKADNYDALEEQIGGLGDVEQPIPSSPSGKTLGKAKYYGNEERVKESREEVNARIESVTNKYKSGYIKMDMEEFGPRAQFYPEDWEFYIKPASVEDIKNWSSIDEERPDQVQEVLNEIIKSCVKIIKKDSNAVVSWGKINSWDRFFLILKVREYTFSKGEQRIAYTEPCESCDNEIEFELSSNSLVFDLPDQDIVNRHWDPVNRIWSIDPSDYDVEGSQINLYIPTLEKENVIFNWALDEARNNKKLQETFIKFLPWLVKDVARNDRYNEKAIKDAEKVYRGWDMDMFDLMDEVLRNITITPSEQLKTICSHCGEEVSADVKFPNGIRGLFSVQSRRKKFGQK